MGKVVKEMCGRNLRDKTDGDICQIKNSLLVFSSKRTRRCILIFISYFSMFISHTVRPTDRPKIARHQYVKEGQGIVGQMAEKSVRKYELNIWTIHE